MNRPVPRAASTLLQKIAIDARGPRWRWVEVNRTQLDRAR